ncbi:hypothetical protein NKH37_11250 [Mesorhizobium sp. M1217]|uniref:hypothetical protein n=1 Tax=Mesorhizobium sp. M1217 TaxID=2957070 RepID=UPI003337E99D
MTQRYVELFRVRLDDGLADFVREEARRGDTSESMIIRQGIAALRRAKRQSVIERDLAANESAC